MNENLIERDKRFDYWNYLTNEKSIVRPRTVTYLRLMQIKQSVIADDDFWFQVIGRFGAEISASAFYKSNSAAAIESRSNFWAMVREKVQIVRGGRK